jgi:hypothetical protein
MKFVFALGLAAAFSVPAFAKDETYIQVDGMSFTAVNRDVESKGNNVTTSQEVTASRFGTAFSGVKLVSFFDNFAVRLSKNFDEGTYTTGANTFGIPVGHTHGGAWEIAGGYLINDMLEVGPFLSYDRIAGTDDTDPKKTATASVFLTGPYVNFQTEINSDLGIEAEGRLGYKTASAETKTGNTTVQTIDSSGFVFSADAYLTVALTKQFSYLGGLGLGYASETNEAGSNETSTKDVDYSLYLAKFRYKF